MWNAEERYASYVQKLRFKTIAGLTEECADKIGRFVQKSGAQELVKVCVLF